MSDCEEENSFDIDTNRKLTEASGGKIQPQSMNIKKNLSNQSTCQLVLDDEENPNSDLRLQEEQGKKNVNFFGNINSFANKLIDFQKKPDTMTTSQGVKEQERASLLEMGTVSEKFEKLNLQDESVDYNASGIKKTVTFSADEKQPAKVAQLKSKLRPSGAAQPNSNLKNSKSKTITQPSISQTSDSLSQKNLQNPYDKDPKASQKKATTLGKVLGNESSFSLVFGDFIEKTLQPGTRKSKAKTDKQQQQEGQSEFSMSSGLTKPKTSKIEAMFGFKPAPSTADESLKLDELTEKKYQKTMEKERIRNELSSESDEDSGIAKAKKKAIARGEILYKPKRPAQEMRAKQKAAKKQAQTIQAQSGSSSKYLNDSMNDAFENKFALNKGKSNVQPHQLDYGDDNECGVDFDEIVGNYVASSITLNKIQQQARTLQAKEIRGTLE